MATAKKAKKAAKKAPAKKTTEKKQPSLTRTVNMGPERGDNSFPPGNKPMSKDRSRAPARKTPKRAKKGGAKGE